MTIICPKCSNIVSFNTYFGAYMCKNCNWKDDSYNKNRVKIIKPIRESKHEVTSKNTSNC